MFFCKKCKNFSPADRCGYCGAKRLRQAKDNDPVFLTEVKGIVYAGLLDGALEHNNIPFIKQERHGGILKYVGISTGIEYFNFYVPFGAYEKSKQILAEIFKKDDLRLAKSSKAFKQVERRRQRKWK